VNARTMTNGQATNTTNEQDETIGVLEACERQRLNCPRFALPVAYTMWKSGQRWNFEARPLPASAIRAACWKFRRMECSASQLRTALGFLESHGLVEAVVKRTHLPRIRWGTPHYRATPSLIHLLSPDGLEGFEVVGRAPAHEASPGNPFDAEALTSWRADFRPQCSSEPRHG